MSSPAPHLALPKLPALRSIQVFGQTIKYYDHGEGEPLLLVHGLGADADVWAYCFDALCRSHRVIAPDLLGFGRSSKPQLNYRVGTFVEVLDRFLQSLNVRQAAIMGSSMGGWISAGFALQFPQRVSKLVLCNAIGLVEGSVEAAVDFRPSSLENMRNVMEFIFYDKRLATNGLIETAYEFHLERNDGPTIASMLETIHQKLDRLDDTLGEMQTPTLLIWGDSDGVSPVSVGEAYARRIQGSRLEVIPQCGHLPAMEKPNELVERVLRFLAE